MRPEGPQPVFGFLVHCKCPQVAHHQNQAWTGYRMWGRTCPAGSATGTLGGVPLGGGLLAAMGAGTFRMPSPPACPTPAPRQRFRHLSTSYSLSYRRNNRACVESPRRATSSGCACLCTCRQRQFSSLCCAPGCAVGPAIRTKRGRFELQRGYEKSTKRAVSWQFAVSHNMYDASEWKGIRRAFQEDDAAPGELPHGCRPARRAAPGNPQPAS